MKRLAMLLLAAALLLSAAACQPTPSEEFVVNKKDSGVAAMLEKDADAEARGAQRVPDRWDEVYESDLMTLTFSAPIVQKEDGLYPLYRTRSNPLTEAEMVNYLTVLFPDPVAVRQNLPTK
ncbi:MAG: hypothetical protein IJR78_00755, partial [Clostridia bacterium]|nr:hypothetical protein [Clostridia bacterium]